MPELPPFNPSVSVFHFTSNVSSNKIKKYKAATERGMTQPSKSAKNAAARKSESAIPDQPVAKKPRLKLKVREPKPTDDDTIAVSRPKCGPSAKSLGYQDALMPVEGLNDKVLPTPALSSGLSSLGSAPPLTKETTPAKRPAPGSARESYGDLMSYYILDGDDDDPKDEQPRPAKKAKTTSALETTRRPVENSLPSRQQKQTGLDAPLPRDRQRPIPPPTHLLHPNSQQMHPPPMPPAQVPVIEDLRVANPDSVPVMLQKLQALSEALVDFGVPPGCGAFADPSEYTWLCLTDLADLVTEEESPVDDLLAMFGDDNDSKDGSEGGGAESRDADKIKSFGTPDVALIHGIYFINNALRSWAYQRVYLPQFHRAQQGMAAPVNLGQRHGPGRPKRSANGAVATPQSDQPSSSGFLGLEETREGRTIAAFQQVLASGCLCMNAVVPVELGKALSRLYLQIHHLISDTPRIQPEWRCVSYGAQIEANRVIVARWKDAQERATQEMIREQQLAHQTVMRQMGLPPQSTATMFFQQPHDPHATDAERRNNSQNLVRLPTHPRPFANPSPAIYGGPGSSAAYFTSQMPFDAFHGNGQWRGQAHPANSNIALPPASMPHGLPAAQQTNGFPQMPQGANGLPFARMRQYMPGYLPRSGQSMKFSFVPNNEAAIHAFGPQAFPALSQSPSNLPSTGHSTSAPPVPAQNGMTAVAAPANGAAASDDVQANGGEGHAHPRRTDSDAIMSDAANPSGHARTPDAFKAISARAQSTPPPALVGKLQSEQSTQPLLENHRSASTTTSSETQKKLPTNGASGLPS